MMQKILMLQVLLPISGSGYFKIRRSNSTSLGIFTAGTGTVDTTMREIKMLNQELIIILK